MPSDTGPVDPLAYDAEHDEPAPDDAVDDSIGQGCCSDDPHDHGEHERP